VRFQKNTLPSEAFFAIWEVLANDERKLSEFCKKIFKKENFGKYLENFRSQSLFGNENVE
jgi:hypothetical protein